MAVGFMLTLVAAISALVLLTLRETKGAKMQNQVPESDSNDLADIHMPNRMA